MRSQGLSLKGCLAITTDDGFKENYETIAPILDENNLTASFFIITNSIDNNELMWRNRIVYIVNKFPIERVLFEANKISKDFLQETIDLKTSDDLMQWSLARWEYEDNDLYSSLLWEKFMPKMNEFMEQMKPYLTTSQIKELSDSGFDIGSHSCSHPDLSKVSWNNYKDEVINSVIKLKEITNQEIISFSYPFGKRASDENESKLINRYPELISSLVGIRNRNENNINAYKWERDLQEDVAPVSRFRFLIMPHLRKIL